MSGTNKRPLETSSGADLRSAREQCAAERGLARLFHRCVCYWIPLVPSRQTSGKLSPMRETVSAHSSSVPKTSGRTGRLFLPLLSVRRCRQTTWIRDALLLLLLQVRASGGTSPCAFQLRRTSRQLVRLLQARLEYHEQLGRIHTCCLWHLSRV